MRFDQVSRGAPLFADFGAVSWDGLDARRANLALNELIDLPMRRVAHRPLLNRCWQLRENLTVHGAAYVALAESLGLVLVTTDAHLSGAPGLRCEVDLFR